MPLSTPKRLSGSTPSHARSKVQELDTAKRIKGGVVKASGALFEKGDVRRRKLVRIEAKTTKNSSFSVTDALIDKLEEACFGADEIPIMQIELRLGERKVIVMPDYALDVIIELLERR